VSVFEHPTGQFCLKAFTGKGLIVGTAVEKQGRQASIQYTGQMNKTVKS